MPHSYLLMVFLGQLELCPLAFQRLGVQGPPCTHLSLRFGGTAVQAGSQCREQAAADDSAAVHLCPPPPPSTHLPSVCEINLVFVWVSAASVALLRHRSQGKGKKAFTSLMPIPYQLSDCTLLICTELAPRWGGKGAGWRTLWPPDRLVRG